MGWVRFATCLLAGAAAASATGACAMSAPEQQRDTHCSVTGSEKLPAEAGGADAICNAIERALAARAPNIQYVVEVRVRSASMMAATLIVGGRTLPDQNFAVMDRNLNRGSIERFARAIADALAEASKS